MRLIYIPHRKNDKKAVMRKVGDELNLEFLVYWVKRRRREMEKSSMKFFLTTVYVKESLVTQLNFSNSIYLGQPIFQAIIIKNV